MLVLLSDTEVSSIPVLDSGEKLVDLHHYGLDFSGADDASRFVRAGVAARLARAQDALPPGIRIVVNQGHRRPEEQQSIIDRYRATLRERHPGIEQRELEHLSSRFVAPLEVAPHVAGAAADLTLADASGPLWMGTEIDETPEQSHDACFFAATSISAEARRNRTLLAAALEAQGLVNYPTEWWHWSFGDRYWAWTTGSGFALYGPVAGEG